jgi:hypothetical protein
MQLADLNSNQKPVDLRDRLANGKPELSKATACVPLARLATARQGGVIAKEQAMNLCAAQPNEQAWRRRRRAVARVV